MGWKFYTIFVKDHTLKDNDEVISLLSSLNLKNYEYVGEIGLDESLNTNFFCIGNVDNSLLITHQNLAMDFFDETKSKTENAIIDRFPKSEICSLVYFSTTDLYGYSLIRNGKRIRVKSGSDGEVFVNVGKRLDIEKEIKKKGVFDKEELEEMKEEFEREEINMMIDDAVGIRTVFAMTGWYLGKPIDEGNFDSIKLLKYSTK